MKTEQPLRARLIGSLLSLTFAVLVIAGTVYEQNWAWNLAAFFMWIFTIIQGFLLLAVLTDENTRRKFATLGPTVPLRVFIPASVILALLMVAFNHWFYALMWLTRMVMYLICNNADKIPPIIENDDDDDDDA